jgi:hypothetical protein
MYDSNYDLKYDQKGELEKGSEESSAILSLASWSPAENQDRAAVANALPDTPLNQSRRLPDDTFNTRTGRIETWNYPDGTREDRYVGRGGYCTLTRFDAQGRRQEEITVDSGSLIISRSDGTYTAIHDHGTYAYRTIYGADGSTRTDDLEVDLARRAIQNYRKLVMR